METDKSSGNEPKEGDLRVWYLHQIGGSNKVFYKKVDSPDQAELLLASIYDLAIFLEENNYIPDFCNQGGLEVWESDGNGGFEWCEWYDDTGADISELIAK